MASYTYGTSGTSTGKLTSSSWYRDGQSDSETLSYDSLGRLTTHTRVISNRSYTQQVLSFDMFNRPLQVKYIAPSNSSGTTVTIGYDLEGEESFIEGSTQLLSAIDYNVMGQKTLVNRTGSTVKDTSYSYYNVNGNFQLKTIEHGIQNDSLPNYEYVYLDNGNISQITERVYGSSLKTQTQTFTYDFLNRLKTASAPFIDSGLGLTAYNQTFSYDKLGNITSINHNGTVTNYAYGGVDAGPHAVSSTSGGMASSYVYDNNGNMESRTQSGVTYAQTFDGENRLTSVTTGGQTTQFKYDASGQRTMTIAADGSKTFYPFPNMEETTAAADPLDTTLKMTYLVAGQPLAIRTIVKENGTTITANTLHYVYTDHLGSASVVTDSSGGNPQVTRFLPFGGYRNTPTQTVTDRGFTGHMHNDEVGLIYMNARFYVPNIGRFASADTIVPDPIMPQSYNRYAYVYNNPIKLTDPSGHCGTVTVYDGEGNPDETPDTACWSYLEDQFCDDGLCDDWSEWIVIGDKSRWIINQLKSVRQALLETKNALETIGLNWREVLKDTKFVHVNQDGLDNFTEAGEGSRQFAHLAGTIYLSNKAFTTSNPLLSTLHEIGHAVDYFSGRELQDTFHSLIGSGVVRTPDGDFEFQTKTGYCYRLYGCTNKGESTADAFQIMVYSVNGLPLQSPANGLKVVDWEGITSALQTSLSQIYP